MLNESVHDNGKLKFVYIATGAGMGWSFVYDQLFSTELTPRIQDNYFKLVSIGHLWDELLHHAHISTNMLNVTSEQKETASRLKRVAEKLAEKQMTKYMELHFGIVFDGSHRSPYAIADQLPAIEKKGYDTYVVFVDVPLETLLQRNDRLDHPLPRKTIKALWQQTKENKRRFKSVFGDTMQVVTSDDTSDLPTTIQTAIDKIIAAPLKNPRGQRLLQVNKADDDHIALRALVDKRMQRPDSHGVIQVNTALGYAPDSPVRREAEKLIQKSKTRKQ